MHISGHGKTDHLAKLLLGVQEADGPGAKPSAKREAAKDRVFISEQAKELQRIQTLAQEPDQARTEGRTSAAAGSAARVETASPMEPASREVDQISTVLTRVNEILRRRLGLR